MFLSFPLHTNAQAKYGSFSFYFVSLVRSTNRIWPSSYRQCRTKMVETQFRPYPLKEVGGPAQEQRPFDDPVNVVRQ